METPINLFVRTLDMMWMRVLAFRKSIRHPLGAKRNIKMATDDAILSAIDVVHCSAAIARALIERSGQALFSSTVSQHPLSAQVFTQATSVSPDSLC